MVKSQRDMVDGFVTLEAGMHSGISATLLQANQCAFAQNVTFRSGFPETRPGFKRITLSFEDEEKRTWFETHPTQGAIIYDPPNGANTIIVSQGGRQFEIRPEGRNAKVVEITPSTGRNSQLRPLAWMCQAAQYLVIQDGESAAIIYDGAATRRANANNSEIPVGRQMAYGNWRLFVVLPDGRQLLAGDFAYVSPTSVLEFTETQYLAGGGSLAIPLEAGQINALHFMARTNTVSGQGALLAATARAIMSFDPVPLRIQWEQLQGFSAVALLNAGFEAQAGTTTVNGDVWGRSSDGIRSFIQASREFGGWGNTPMSREVQRILDTDTPSLLEHSSAIFFDNRLLMTANPAFLEVGAYHRGIIALNFENVASMGRTGQPAYDGLWTGIHPYKLVTGVVDGQQRGYALCRGTSDGRTQLWEITKDEPFDNDTCAITSSLESRSMNFNQPQLRKEIFDAELWLDNVQETVGVDVKYKADSTACWSDWDNFSECALVKFCDSDWGSLGNCNVFYEAPPQFKWHALGKPRNTVCDATQHRAATMGYEFQVRLQWTGHARIKRFLVRASPKDEAPRSC